jgi:hypothetical protein
MLLAALLPLLFRRLKKGQQISDLFWDEVNYGIAGWP